MHNNIETDILLLMVCIFIILPVVKFPVGATIRSKANSQSDESSSCFDVHISCRTRTSVLNSNYSLDLIVCSVNVITF